MYAQSAKVLPNYCKYPEKSSKYFNETFILERYEYVKPFMTYGGNIQGTFQIVRTITFWTESVYGLSDLYLNGYL